MMAIPKLIHQTMETGDLPDEIKQSVALLKERNPEWKYRFYTANDRIDFVKKNYDQRVVKLYQKINPLYGVAKADLFRYLLIYRVGGAYLDIKSTAKKRLNYIVQDKDYILAYWQNTPKEPLDLTVYPKGEFQQWHVIAVPEHPFLKAVIDLVLENIENYSVEKFGTGKLGVLKTTGPVPYTEAITPLLPLYNHHLHKQEHEIGLRYTIFHNGIEHMKVITDRQKLRHYTKLTEPVVL